MRTKCTIEHILKLSLEKAHDKSKFKVVDDKKMDNSEKAKALDVAMSQIEQNYEKAHRNLAKGPLWMLRLSTGSLSLDVVLGIWTQKVE